MSPAAEIIWSAWARDANFVSRIPEARYPDALTLVSYVLNKLNDPDIIFVDVGCARGDVLHILSDKSGLKVRPYSIGFDPVDVRCRNVYNEFFEMAIIDDDRSSVLINVSAISACSSILPIIAENVIQDATKLTGSNYLAPADITKIIERRIVRSARLINALEYTKAKTGIIHFLKIDAQGVDIGVFKSLGVRCRDVLFVQIETVIEKNINMDSRLYYGQSLFKEDNDYLLAANFRLVNIAEFLITPEADAIYVNMLVLKTLIPELFGVD